MDYEKFTKMQNDEFEFLDSIDLDKYLINNKEVYDIMQEIEKDYKGKFYDSFIFNCISCDEFIDYIQKRYPKITFREVINNYVYRMEE